MMQSHILHSNEGWNLNKEMVDDLRGWESGNLDLTNSRKWRRSLRLAWLEANQIRISRKRFSERRGECMEWLMSQRILVKKN